jgi:hypothetical protein
LAASLSHFPEAISAKADPGGQLPPNSVFFSFRNQHLDSLSRGQSQPARYLDAFQKYFVVTDNQEGAVVCAQACLDCSD